MPNAKFEFLGLPIGQVLMRYRLVVPPNQRAYAWEERHVIELFQDLNAAIQSNDEDYFLGTIVLIANANETFQVADGQQRLATISILLARIRDHLLTIGREASAAAIDSESLRRIDKHTEAVLPILTLNVEDHEFFVRNILPSPRDPVSPPMSNVRPSNERLKQASTSAVKFINDAILAGLRQELHADRILQWVKFIEQRATVVAVIAPDDVGAYRMFETLNDRGLKASQADILKNYFFSRAGTRLPEAQMAWNSMNGLIETLGDDDDDRLVLYLRHFWITTHGPTKERELAASIKNEIANETKTLQFIFDVRDSANDYLAVWSQGHPKWTVNYKASTRKSIHTISEHLKVEQIRPLLFAVSRYFTPEEADKAFRLFVSWSVRFLIFGGRGGLLDQQYSLRAQDVGRGKITKARELRTAMSEYVPTDKQFEDAFSTARVSRPFLARYYLRAIDRKIQNDPEPEFVQNEDESQINLEHIMPLVTSENWPIEMEAALTAQKLLGNMVLLRASKNTLIGNNSFAEKKKVYEESGYLVTNTVAKYDQWTINEIHQRQIELAKIAVTTWPLTLVET